MDGLFGKYRVLLAPMAGVSDIAFRTLSREAGAVSSPSAQPRRNFTVTGCSTAPFTARTMEAASSGSRMRAEPSPFDTILRAGQPMLISR